MEEQLKKKPGRPKIEDNPVEQIKQEAIFQVNMKNIAYSIVEINGKWQLVKIKFNPHTNTVGIPELTLIGGKKSDASDRLKIILARELL